MDPKEIAVFIQRLGEPLYRVRQVLGALCAGVNDYTAINNIPKSLQEKLRQELPLLSFQAEEVLAATATGRISALGALRSGAARASGPNSVPEARRVPLGLQTSQTSGMGLRSGAAKDGKAYKARLGLTDGKKIESVIMRSAKDSWSVCVSSQVGCALKCSFCATGQMGFSRNLTAEEISDQVLFWKQHLRKNGLGGRVGSVVFMGMGEPMLNFEALKKSIRTLTDPQLFALGRRSISVSTAGIPSGIDRFAQEMKQINLAVSLNAANDKLRSRLMPVNKSYPLGLLFNSLERYFKKNNRKVFLEYVLLAGENDSPEQAKELAYLIRRLEYARLIHVNLIVWNQTATSHKKPDSEAAEKFMNVLDSHGINVTIRKSLGEDIAAACGQLIAKCKGSL
ncbi:MAG: 23S rRNA (adenine(2503)-C(2))-methyltransferase RlmN [Elusimicrobia bacterium]|nr:23S rRNA (adenine(2503)-C(2))-methyltransferase RlmN [Elusimicrobiota bacterium]